jgi:threonine aldolase
VTAPARVVDLRSDTLTRPTAAMRQAMAAAEVGDDVYGEDPTVNALEEHVADLLGHEAGLFAPSGSLANQLGLRLHVRPGEEVIADSLAHVLRAEMGAAAVFSGISSRSWVAERGLLDPAQPLALMQPDAGAYQVSTRLVVVENTHNFGGGTVQPLERLAELRRATQPAGVALHVDGARLWNAHVATGTALAAYGEQADTVSVCLSKGLGAPVGSVLVGSRAHVAEARVWRKRYGGGMRQAGILAAAGRWALDHHVERLAQDHEHARVLAEGLARLPGVEIDPAAVATNIVVFRVADAQALCTELASHGVFMGALDDRTVRAVTHLDVDTEGITTALEVLGAALAPA